MRFICFALFVGFILILSIIDINPLSCQPELFHSQLYSSQTQTITDKEPKVNENIQKSDAPSNSGTTQRAYFPSNYDSAPIEIEVRV